MENFAPGLRESVLALSDVLRVIVFFLCVVGFMLQIQQARADAEGLVRPVVRAALVVGLVATLPYWFGFVEKVFLSIADTVHTGYTDHPMRTAAKLRDTVSGGPNEFSLRRIGETFYQAFLYAAGKLVVLVASLLQLPFLVLQFILKMLCYLFLPVALGLFMIPAQAQLAARYVQQTLAILAWPVGFAVTELVAYHLLTAYADNLATAYGLTPGEIDGASFASLLGGLLAGIWIVVGTLATPFLMQALLCSGSPLSGGGANALQQLFTLQQIAAVAKTLETGGAAAPLVMANVAKGAPGGGSGSPPPPSSPPPSKTPTPPSPVSDPAGDHRAGAALAAAALPVAHTTL